MTQMDLLDLLADVDDRTPEEQHFDYVVSRFFRPDYHRLLQLLNARGSRKAQRAIAAEAADGMQGGTDGVRRYSSSRKGVTVHDYETGADYSWTWLQVMDRALAGVDAEHEQEIRADHAAELARRAERRAEFERLARWWPDGTEVIWVAPWDTSGGMKEGETSPGWRCWHCGGVEATDAVLALNHGLDAAWPWTLDRDECLKQWLTASQAKSAAGRDAAKSKDVVA
jgi:hypothetical protein